MVKDRGTHSKYRKRNMMLVRLLLTIAVLICIPLLVGNIFIVHRDVNRMHQQEIKNYQSYTDNFKNFFHDELEKMFVCSIDLGVNKTVTEEVLSDNSKYLWEAFSEIKKYRNSVPIAKDLFVYMRSVDYVIGSENGYNGFYFAKIFFNKNQEWLQNLPEYYHSGKYFVKASGDRGMFAIYPSSIHKAGDTTLFFNITPETLKETFHILDNSNSGLYIYNENGELLLSNREEAHPVIYQKEFSDFVKNFSGNIEKIERYGEEWYVFKSYDGENGLLFLNVVPAEELQQQMQGMKTFNILFLLLESFLCCVMLAFVVYLNYRPIHILKKKYLDDNVGDAENEIDGIVKLLDRAIADRRSLGELVRERTEQLSAYVLRDMLNGEDIPEEQRKLLSVNETIRFTFVMAVQGIEMKSEIEEKVVKQLADIMEKDGIVYSMIDTYERCLMFICFTVNKNPVVRTVMAEDLQKMLMQETMNRNFKLGIGEYCEIAEGIRAARLTSLVALDQCSYGKINYYENALADFKQVEHYPNKQVLAYMRHLKEGNSRQALLMLEQIMDSVRDNQSSFLMKRYVCYDIINEFIRLLASIEVKVEEGKIIKLMRFEGLEELQNILTELTILVCRKIENRKLALEKEQVNRIIQFIDENITDPDLSREMIADRFGISVNTVSLLCTNLIGCGFRELIVARRVELAQKLFLEKDLTVNEVAFCSGFRDASYFIKVFKNITGKTPRVYKSEIKEKE